MPDAQLWKKDTMGVGEPSDVKTTFLGYHIPLSPTTSHEDSFGFSLFLDQPFSRKQGAITSILGRLQDALDGLSEDTHYNLVST